MVVSLMRLFSSRTRIPAVDPTLEGGKRRINWGRWMKIETLGPILFGISVAATMTLPLILGRPQRTEIQKLEKSQPFTVIVQEGQSVVFDNGFKVLTITEVGNEYVDFTSGTITGSLRYGHTAGLPSFRPEARVSFERTGPSEVRVSLLLPNEMP
jgi:hypothetical protein